MQSLFGQYTKKDLSNYPFLKEAAKYVETLNLKIDDLTDPGFNKILKRAEERIEESLLYGIVNRKPAEEVEILSFPVAIMLIIATQNAFIKKRYALSEAKHFFNSVKLEAKEKILALAQNFDWSLNINKNSKIPFEFTLQFPDYLRNTANLRNRWKLVNRFLSHGLIYLGRNDVARLLSEEVRYYIENRLEVDKLPTFPANILDIANKIKHLSKEKFGISDNINTFPSEILESAFPPCIKASYHTVSSSRHLSHLSRFTLTSFLLVVGMSIQDIVGFFKNFSDYNEETSRYQIEHISGKRGSKIRYLPPNCETLQTHGVCVNSDELCKTIRHPLHYYKRKVQSHLSESSQ